MKKIYILIISLIMFSCGEHEDVIYDNVNGQTIAYFKKNSQPLKIEINGTGSTDVVVAVSTVSKTDRNVTIAVNQDDTTADPSLYNITSTTAIIPAGSYRASIPVEGIYNSTLDNQDFILALDLISVDGARIDQPSTNLILSRYCPVPETFFTGSYLIEQVSPYIDGPSLSDGAVVNVTAEGTKRTFSTQNYPDYCAPYMDFSFDLNCNNIVVDILDSVCSCGDGSAWFGPAMGANATYDISAGDAVMYVTFADDRQQNCGPTQDTTYKFTKQ